MVGPLVRAPDLGVEPAAQRAVGRDDPLDLDALQARRARRPQPGGIVELEIGAHDGLGHLGYLARRGPGAGRARARYSRRDGHIRLSAHTRHAGRWEWHVRRPWRRRLTWSSS